MHALIVEDNEGDRFLIEDAFRQACPSARLSFAHDGVEALSKLRVLTQGDAADQPTLMLLDLKLPRKSGIEVLAAIKSDTGIRRLPIFVLSNSNSPDDVAAAYENYATAYFTKPDVSYVSIVECILTLVATSVPSPAVKHKAGSMPSIHNPYAFTESRFRLAVESSPSAMVMVDAHGTIEMINAEAERMFCYSREELVGQNISELVPSRLRNAHFVHRQGFMHRPERRAMGTGRELFALRKDGKEFPVEIGLNPIETPEGTFVLSAIVDISERKQADERFRLAVESSPNAMLMVDHNGQIVMVNAETERMFGHKRSDLVGQPIEMLVPRTFRFNHPTHVWNFMTNPERRVMGAGRDLYGLRSDGTEFPVEIGLNPIQTPDGILVLSAVVDITARKRAETALEQKSEELARSNAELEQFAYIASHDLREPLRMVSSFTRLLAERYMEKLDEGARRYIEYASEGAERMQHLIDDLLAYARVTTRGRALQPVDTDQAVDKALLNLHVQIEENQAVIKRSPLPWVMADETQLIELLQNLVGNAIKFRGKDTPEISISGVTNGSRCEFSVQDNGIGIPEDLRERAFQVFQSLHPREKYPGTGIGLAICKRIVERFGGKISVDDAPGGGCIFHFILPTASPHH